MQPSEDKEESNSKIKWLVDKLDRFVLFKRPQEPDLNYYLVNCHKTRGIDYYEGNTGLLNLGNNCYMNCVMQALLLNNRLCLHTIMTNSKTPFWWSMAQLFAKMKYSAAKKLNPQKFYNLAIPAAFRINEQQDSSEFLSRLILLLEWLENAVGHECWIPTELKFVPAVYPNPNSSSSLDSQKGNNVPQRHLESGSKRLPKTPELPTVYEETNINRMFRGQYTTQIMCSICENVTFNEEKFLELQLGIPGNKRTFSVQKLVDKFFKPVTLENENMYFCNECQCLVKGTITTTLDDFPEYLILSIKYFSADSNGEADVKPLYKFSNNEKIKLPRRSFEPDYTYEQYAAVIHQGVHIESGHYFTIGKKYSEWFIYDDEVVIGTTTNGINSLQKYCIPYIIFYKRSDVADLPEPTFDALPAHIREMLYNDTE